MWVIARASANPFAKTLVLLATGLLFLVACSSSPSPRAGDGGGGNVNAQAVTSVLILYPDGPGVFGDSNGVSLQAKPTMGTVQLKPGLAHDKSNRSKSKGKDKRDQIGAQAMGDVQTQAYSYPDAAQIYSIMLTNLLGRYADVVVTRKAVSTYTAGEANQYYRTFYIGSTYEDPVPTALISDIMGGAKVTWLNYNIWRLDNAAIGASLSRLGLRYVALYPEYQPAEFSVGFNKIDYRGYTFKKYIPGLLEVPIEMMEVAAETPSVVVHAWAKNSAGWQIPYALQSGNFWYVADNPFTYIHEQDRYLVFADLIAPMMGRDVTCTPRALARMEDLSPNDLGADLKRMLDAINKVKIPFLATVIPLFVDNNTLPVTQISWTQNNGALNQLRRIPSIRGRIFQHGYTHQFENLKNPSGISGDDWEFWRVELDANGNRITSMPIPGMTATSALQRIQAGRTILVNLSTRSANTTPVGWTTPHYEADPSYYATFNQVYNRVMERRIYRVGTVIAGQFFPYPVRDVNGTLMLPETLGSVQPNYLLPMVEEAARANRVLRCPWAGHFFHAYTIDPDYNGPNAYTVAQFEGFLRYVRDTLGYTYVDPTTVTTQ